MKTKYFVAAVAGALLALTSCVKDLETLPLNDWDVTSETAYGTDRTAYIQGLAKIYFNFTSNDTTDLLVSDAGASELIRAFWSCQEVSTDEVKCAWGDAWAEAINRNMYDDSENDMVYGVFVRTLQGISYVNEYLRQTTSGKLEERGVDSYLANDIAGFRAEARFLRAYFYWMAMDIFGDVPFTTEDSPFGAVNPKQKSRKEVYEFIVSELEALAADDSAMPAAQSNRPRADKGSVLGLLARVYLNAEVYCGTPAYDKAKQTCEKIFTLGYMLCPEYEPLFRGDNGENPQAYNEFLFSAYYDENNAKSWGGGTFLTCAAINSNETLADTDIEYQVKDEDGNPKVDADGNPVMATKKISRLGVGGGWLGLHIHEHFVNTHFAPTDVVFNAEGDGSYTIADKRGANIFVTSRREKGDFSELQNTFTQGWGCWKYNNIPHDETGLAFWERTGSPDKQTNIDYPLIRLGEIYLIYAESCVRLGQDIALAQTKMNELAERTGVAPISLPGAWDDAAMKLFREERGRELLWEGHRRTDLIRYKSYCEGTYVWPFKGGSVAGQEFPKYKELFAIPVSQLLANPELHNPEGYN